jgi:hypothetical protein
VFGIIGETVSIIKKGSLRVLSSSDCGFPNQDLAFFTKNLASDHAIRRFGSYVCEDEALASIVVLLGKDGCKLQSVDVLHTRPALNISALVLALDCSEPSYLCIIFSGRR